MMKSTSIRIGVLCLIPVVLVLASHGQGAFVHQARPDSEASEQEHPQLEEKTLNVHYLEVVTPSVNETCDALAKTHGVVFGDPIAELGNARTANLDGGGRIAVRGPMHDAEKPAVRPYVLVEDIKAAIETAEAAGATVMVPPMALPGQGTIAIYTLGGIEHGLWQQ